MDPAEAPRRTEAIKTVVIERLWRADAGPPAPEPEAGASLRFNPASAYAHDTAVPGHGHERSLWPRWIRRGRDSPRRTTR